MLSNMLKQLIIWPVRLYQKYISPLTGANCRYTPTCSSYMIIAVEEWGLLKGTWLGLKRIFRCHPWAGFGPDPVPINKKRRKQNSSKAN